MASQTWQEEFAMKGILEDINKVPTQKWKEMGKAFKAIESAAMSGAFSMLQAGFGDVKGQMQNQVTGVMNTLFAPMMNAIGVGMSKINQGIRGWFRSIEDAGAEFKRRQMTQEFAGTRYMTDEERKEALSQYQVLNTDTYSEEVELLKSVNVPTKVMNYKDTLY